jgi:lipid A 3-O-deacylase
LNHSVDRLAFSSQNLVLLVVNNSGVIAMDYFQRFSSLVVLLVIATVGPARGAATLTESVLSTKSIWESGVGGGFRTGVQSVGITAGVNYDLTFIGDHQLHKLALVSFSYGRMLGPIQGENHWYRGNFEFRFELFSGAEYSPSVEWLVGLAPHLRYNFATGTRWVPFVDCGAGLTATSIGPPDLSGIFEFNLQIGGGLHWFIKDNLAVTLEGRFLHLSCAGINSPNHGINGAAGLVGFTIFL